MSLRNDLALKLAKQAQRETQVTSNAHELRMNKEARKLRDGWPPLSRSWTRRANIVLSHLHNLPFGGRRWAHGILMIPGQIFSATVWRSSGA